MKKIKSGQDIDLGNRCSGLAYAWAKKTFGNRSGKPGQAILKADGGFASQLLFGNNRIGISSDGIGTKIELAERTGIYRTLGFDLTAMVVDDLAANGFEATNVSNILDVDYLNAEIVDQLMEGLHDAAEAAGTSVTGGEIAELGGRICGFGSDMHFNWCATALGVLPDKLDDIIDGREIKPGDIVISLKSDGLRSNGFSLVREIMRDNFGEDWHDRKYNGQYTWGQILIRPSRIFCTLIKNLIKAESRIHGMVHVTGGGIADNLGRVLRMNGKGAKLDHLFEPPEFVLKLQQIGKVPEEKAYNLWNMGNAFMLIADNSDIEMIMKIIVNNGFMPRIAGRIVDEPMITLKTLGMEKAILKTTVV